MGTKKPDFHQLQVVISKICKKIKRNPEEIDILVASKYADVQKLNEVIQSGAHLIGENRIQDAKMKFPFLLPVKKHFIGTLQTNKVNVAVRLFDIIESVDRLELAEAINTSAKKYGKIMPIFLQINIAEDSRKHGISPEKLPDFLSQIKTLPNISVRGFMTILPYFENPENARPYFKLMKKLSDLFTIKSLSMGMSHDFAIAIEEGATEIRIGSWLFREKF